MACLSCPLLEYAGGFGMVSYHCRNFVANWLGWKVY